MYPTMPHMGYHFPPKEVGIGLWSAPIPNLDNCDNLDNMASAVSSVGRTAPRQAHNSELNGLCKVAHHSFFSFPVSRCTLPSHLPRHHHKPLPPRRLAEPLVEAYEFVTCWTVFCPHEGRTELQGITSAKRMHSKQSHR